MILRWRLQILRLWRTLLLQPMACRETIRLRTEHPEMPRAEIRKRILWLTHAEFALRWPANRWPR